MKTAFTSAQIHFENIDSIRATVSRFNYNGNNLVSVGFGQPLSCMDVFMTEKQFGELVDKLTAARAEMA